MRPTTLYVTSAAEYDKHKSRLKLVPCPHCRVVGFLNQHGYLKGHGEDVNDEIKRGWRIFCCNRDRRKGCGRTYSVLLAKFLFRRMVKSSHIWQLLRGLRKGLCTKAAWEKVPSPFSLQTGYRLRNAFAQAQTFIRSMLLRAATLPKLSAADPQLQVIEHLRAAFPRSSCPVGEFQLHFQAAFLHVRPPRVNRSG
jgi:hypothetical protein